MLGDGKKNAQFTPVALSLASDLQQSYFTNAGN